MEVDEQDYSETEGSGVMVSNLPLLFAHGIPSALGVMSQSELEVFVPFMVRCSVGEERPVPWLHLPRPPWWPKKLPFRLPPSKTLLMGLVERCYSFHGCDYLLQFCNSLVAQMPPSGYRFNDNRDGTTSMYHGTTGKLFVTFRNENRDYDKVSHGGKARDATKKLLLSPTPHTGGSSGSSGSSSTAMIQPPITDIYLCDKCENEFYSLKEVQAHERHCCGEVSAGPPTPSPEPETAEEEPEPTGQVSFLSYFNLRPAQHTGLQPYTSPRKKSASSPPAKLLGPIYPRFDSIALSSPLGRYLFVHSKFRNKFQVSQHSVMRYERHLHATPNTDMNFRERYASRWIVVWRNRKERPPWVHLYCFNRAQRRERTLTLKTGLDRQSRHLLRLCRPLAVQVSRLPKRIVDRLLRVGGPTSTAPCIDLTQEQHQVRAVQQRPRPLDALHTYWVGPGGPAGRGSAQLQWVSGLPAGQGGACLPGSSGALAPHYGSQLGLQGTVGLSVTPHGSFNFIPLVAGNNINQQQQQQQQVASTDVLTSVVSSRPSLPLVADDGQFPVPRGQPVQKGAGQPYLPLLSEVSISQVVPTAAAQPTHSELEADRMKPLSKKKFSGLLESCNSQDSRQQGRASVSLSVAELLPPLVAGKGSTQAQPLPDPVPHASSSIEVIELSSDEDEHGHDGQGRGKAAGALRQPDGLALHPPAGIGVPSQVSEYSSSKNGNSHWSSQQKSRCGAGRVGDLATNGQPLNALPSPLTTSLSSSSSSSHGAPHTQGSGCKRKSEEELPLPRGSKTIVLDISSRGTTVSMEECPCALATTTSVTSDTGCPQMECLRATEEAVVPLSSFLGQSATVAQTSRVLQSSGSATTDENASFPAPRGQTRQWLRRKEALPTLQQEVASGLKFMTSLVTKGIDLFKSLVGKDSKAVAESLPGPPSLAFPRRACRACVPPKRTSEVQKLLRDECRELQRSGLRELRRLDLQGTRLTRKTVGHILPSQPPRKSKNRPLQGSGNEGRKETNGWGPFAPKGPASLGLDENGNSPSVVRVEAGLPHGGQWPAPVAGMPDGEWKAEAVAPLFTAERSDRECGGVGGVGKSTVMKEVNTRNCEHLTGSCDGVWPCSATSTVKYAVCRMAMKTKVNAAECEAETKDVFGSVTPHPWQARGPAGGKQRRTCGHEGGAASGTGAAVSASRGTGGDAAYVAAVQKATDVPAGWTSAPVGPAPTGKTAEERDAQAAPCPPSDRPPGGSSVPPDAPLQRKCLRLFNSVGEERHPLGEPRSDPPTRPRPHPGPPPGSRGTSRRKRGRVCRELLSLGQDEWKEMKGTGFHPSDLLGCEEVRYLGVSSDEDEAPSPTPAWPARASAAADGKPATSAKLSREVAGLLGDECKELRGRPGRRARRDGDGDKKARWRGVHSLAHSIGKLLEGARGPGGAWSRCDTRSRVNSESAVEVFTPRDCHRHLLRSEVAMCVLSYQLPNIH